MKTSPLKKLVIGGATGFGLGLMPIASGTFGTVPGILIAWSMRSWSWPVHGVAALLCVLIAVPICDVAEKHFGEKDDGRIVADEYLTFPLTMVGLLSAPWWMYGIAFVSHRVFDVIKLPPSRNIQRLHGGPGIVADDFFSALYSLAFNHGAFYAMTHWLGL